MAHATQVKTVTKNYRYSNNYSTHQRRATVRSHHNGYQSVHKKVIEKIIYYKSGTFTQRQPKQKELGHISKQVRQQLRQYNLLFL